MGLPGEPGPPISATDPLLTLWREIRQRRQRLSYRSQSFVFGLFGPRRPSKSAREAIFKVPERACARSWLPWCFLNDFWLQKIAILASKMTFFVNVFWPRWVFVGHWFLVGFRYASPLKFSRFGRCAKKAQMAFDL